MGFQSLITEKDPNASKLEVLFANDNTSQGLVTFKTKTLQLQGDPLGDITDYIEYLPLDHQYPDTNFIVLVSPILYLGSLTNWCCYQAQVPVNTMPIRFSGKYDSNGIFSLVFHYMHTPLLPSYSTGSGNIPTPTS